MNINKIALVYSQSSKSSDNIEKIKKLYAYCDVEDADVIMVAGGDGELLHNIHRYMHLNIPFYGINLGSLGFLMNPLDIKNILQNMQESTASILNPLLMQAEAVDSQIYEALAINEVSIFRKTNQAAKFRIEVNGVERMSELVADGALVATPAGSSAYNLSAGGHILPLESNMLCLTPICSFRPRRWHGALLPSSASIKFEILNTNKRPVNATADFQEFSNIKSVTIKSTNDKSIKLLFNKNHTLEDRIIKEQFGG
ncbi:NAD kinase [Rickettsia endosymbiont of Nabis limbatus]|uniref:NAD kinase n=1 Tax=Rickettsia endosymbiont of Nabis limbatus TaxID=3066268 RepID=UPI003AF3ACBA